MRSLVAGPAAWGLVEDAGTAGWRLVGAVVAADGCFAVSGWGTSGLQAASTITLSSFARTEIFVLCKFVMCTVSRTGGVTLQSITCSKVWYRDCPPLFSCLLLVSEVAFTALF